MVPNNLNFSDFDCNTIMCTFCKAALKQFCEKCYINKLELIIIIND